MIIKFCALIVAINISCLVRFETGFVWAYVAPVILITVVSVLKCTK